MRRDILGMGLCLSGLLAGCGEPSDPDIRQWMQEQYSHSKPQLQPVAPPTAFVPQAYGAAEVDPFGSDRWAALLRSESDTQAPAATSALLRAEQRRRKEPLESFAIEDMHMAGVLERRAYRVALVKVGGLLYQVRVGNYLGPHFGRVTKITEAEVVGREIVQDALGEWSERAFTLRLQEENSR